MAKSKYDRETLHAGDIHEPESIVRDDFSRPTFAETEMKLQGTKAYEYNARKTETKVQKEPYYESLGHCFFWMKQIHLPVIRQKGKDPAPKIKRKAKDRSLVIVVVTLVVICAVMFCATNWESLRQTFTVRTSGNVEVAPEDERAEYETGADCVAAFLACVADEDASNAMRCLDTYAGMTDYGCQMLMKKYIDGTGTSEGFYARTLLGDLIEAYGDGSVDFDSSYDIIDYSSFCYPKMIDGQRVIVTNLELETTQGDYSVSMNIPTKKYSENYYISYEAIN